MFITSRKIVEEIFGISHQSPYLYYMKQANNNTEKMTFAQKMNAYTTMKQVSKDKYGNVIIRTRIVKVY